MTFDYRPLSDYADIKGGKRLPKDRNLIKTPNSHPYIRIRDLGKEKVLELTSDYEYVDDETQATIARYIVDTGDVIISIVGTIGLVAKVGNSLDKANLTENCAKVTNIHGLNRDFLYYYLLSQHGQNAIKSATVGAVQAKLPLKNIQALPMPDISLDEQRAIANILSALDTLIAQNKQINHHLVQIAQVLFKSWFESFDPWNGKFPETWTYTNLGNLCSLIAKGITPQYDESSAEMVINQKCIRNKTIDLSLARRHKPKRINEKWLQYGDVLINSTGEGTLGRVAQFFMGDGNITVDSHITIVRPIEEQLVFFIGQWCLDRECEFAKMASGSTGQTDLPRERLKTMECLLPDSLTLQKFSQILKPIVEMQVAAQKESVRLATLRDTLLPRLMSGEQSIAQLDADK